MGRLEIRVGSVPHKAIAPRTPVRISFDERGCKEASWQIVLAKGKRHPALYHSALVEVLAGAKVVWAGVLAEPNWAGGTMTASGLGYDGSAYPALDGSGAGSAVPSVVATANQGRGWKILGVAASVPTTAFTAGADGSNSQTDLFAANADELGQRFYVGADRILRFAADPVSPTLHIRPKQVDLGVAGDDYASTVFVQYRSGISTNATAVRTDLAAYRRFGFRGYLKDVTEYGVITAAKANAIGDGILAKGKARLGFTSTIEVGRNQLTTSGGVPTVLSMVEGGRQMLRAHGIFDDLRTLGGATYLDVPIGESVYDDGSDLISLSPAGKVAETLDEISEAQTRLALGVA